MPKIKLKIPNYKKMMEKYDVDPNNPMTWKKKCDECGKIMEFRPQTLSYACSCGNRYEV